MMTVNSCLTGKRGISLPFTDFCDPLIDESFDSSSVSAQMMRIGNELGWKSMELRGADNLYDHEIAANFYYGHSLDLTGGPEQTFSNLKSSTRQNIRKAIKSGVTVSAENSLSAMSQFYWLFCLNRKKHGLPPPPFLFFKNVLEHILLNKYGSLFLAKYNGKIIAAAIFFHFLDKVIFKYGASDIRYLPVRANNLIKWEAIQHYSQMGARHLDFGKTSLENEGLRRYKLGYGAHERKIYYYKYNFAKKLFCREQSKEYGWHNHFFSKMPISTLKLIGLLLYRHCA